MAKDKKSFVLYADYIDLFEELNDKEAGKLIKHILRYVNDQNPQAPDRITKLSFEPIKKQLKRDLKSYEEMKVRRAEWGKKGGEKSAELRKQSKPTSTPLEPTLSSLNTPQANQADNVTDTVTVNDTVTVTDINNNTASGDKRQTTQSTIYLKYSDYDRLGANLKDQVSWKEKCQIEFGLKEHEFNAWVDKWIAHIGTQAEQTRYLAPSQNYCANWIRKKLEHPETKSTNNNALTGRRVQR